MKMLKNIKNKVILSLVLMTSFTVLSAQDLKIVDITTPIYSIKYSQVYQQPILVEYTVICKPTAKSYSRSGISFTGVSGVKTSNSDDYKNNVWDKGHMVPANTFDCREDWLKSTFSYANCALQHENLNRGAWAELEAFERDLSMVYDDIDVSIEIYFSDQWTSNSDPARIPANFVKSITWREKDGTKKTITFDFPNTDTNGKSFWSFLLDDSINRD